MSFPFDTRFQLASLRLMLEDDAFCMLGLEHFKPTFFENAALAWCFSMITEHYQRYARPPSAVALYDYLRGLDPLVAQQYQATVAAVEATAVTEPQFISDRVVEFVKRNMFVEGFEQARRLYNKGDVESAYDFWQKRADELHTLTLGAVDRGFYFDDFEERVKRRRTMAIATSLHTFATGIPDLDAVLNGGLSLGELGAWIAYQKVGKSMLLAWFVFFALRALRIRVLVTVHEGSREFWEERLDAAFAHVLTSLVRRGEMNADLHRRMVDEFRELRGLLVIRGFTKSEKSWNANVGDILKELRELRARKGFVPQMIVVDYADLLRAREGRDLSETQHQTAAWRDLKTLTTMDQGYAIWTASQAQRKPPRADRDPEFLLRSESIADAIGKVRVADFYGSINRTTMEKEARRARLYAEDYRHGRAGVVIPVETDYDNGRFVKSVLQAYVAPPPQQDEIAFDG